MTATENPEVDAEAGQGETWSYEAVRANVEELLESDEASDARRLLDEVAGGVDEGWTVEQNVWMYRMLGELNEESGAAGEAARAYRQAFEHDPREESVLRPLARLLVDGEADLENESAIEVVQSLLVHHMSELAQERRAEMYRKLGSLYEKEGEYDRARSNFEQAVEYLSDDERALTGLLRTVGAVGEPTDIIEVRRRLIDSFEEAEARSMALVALGDDWIERFNDPGRAIDAYDDAIVEDPDNDRAYQKLHKAAQENEDWTRVYRACLELGRLSEEEETEAEWLIEASNIARDKMWEPERALAGYRRALELNPDRFDAFKAVTSILVDARDWQALERAYLNAIENQTQRDADTQILVVLWQNLGDLYKIHLEDVDSAVTAYHRASEYVPNNLELHEKVANLAEKDADRGDVALQHLKAIWERDKTRFDVLDRIGRVYLRREEVDPALCHFRAIDYLGGELGEKPRGFVQRFKTKMYKTPSRPLDWQVLIEYLAPEGLDTDITQVFRSLYEVLLDWTAERRSEYGLNRKDRVNLDDALAFNNIYREVGQALGYSNLPELWRKSDQKGLVKAALKPQSLIVGDDLMTSGDEKRMAFNIGRRLFLMYQPFYLLGLRTMSDLQAFFVLAIQMVRPDFDVERSDQMERAYRKMDKAISGQQRTRLKQAIEAATGGTREIVLGNWTEAIDDTANRVGLLFCDDLEVCASEMRRDEQNFSERSIDERMKNLAEYTVGERYRAFRDEFGLSIG